MINAELETKSMTPGPKFVPTIVFDNVRDYVLHKYVVQLQIEGFSRGVRLYTSRWDKITGIYIGYILYERNLYVVNHLIPGFFVVVITFYYFSYVNYLLNGKNGNYI